MTKKKKTIIISSTLGGVLGASAIIGTAVALSLNGNEQEELIGDGAQFYKLANTGVKPVDPINKPNQFEFTGNNLRKLKTKDFFIRDGRKLVDYKIISQRNDKLIVQLNTILNKFSKLNCKYKNLQVATIDYSPYPVFEAPTPIMPMSKNSSEFIIKGQNLDLVDEKRFKVYDMDKASVRYKIEAKSAREMKVSITKKFTENTNLECKNNKDTVATLNYVVPRPEGVSDLIPNYKNDDNVELEKPINPEYLPPQQTVTHPATVINAPGDIKVTDEYFLESPQFKQNYESKYKSQFPNIVKDITKTKLKEILGDNYEQKYKLLTNIEEKNNFYTIACQINDKNKNKEMINSRFVVPYLAFKFDFDFRNVQFKLDNDFNLILNDVKTSATFDDNGKITSKPNYLELNNKPTLLNTKFTGLVKSEGFNSELQNWNHDRLSNPDFVNGISDRVKNLINDNINTFRDLFDIVQDLGTQLSTNPTIRNFLYSFKTPIVKFLKQAKANQTFIDFIEEAFKEKPNAALISSQLEEIKNKGIISQKAYGILSKGFTAAGSKCIIDYLLDMPQAVFETTLGTASLLLPKKIRPVIGIVKTYTRNLRKISPNRKIADLPILSSIADPDMKFFIYDCMPSLRKLIPSKICDLLEKIKPVWNQVSFTVDNLKNFFTNIFNPKISKSWGKDPNVRLTDYFRNYTELKLMNQTIKANPDYQTLNIDATYRLVFKKDMYIEMDPAIDMIKSIDLSTLIKLLNVSLPDWAWKVIDFFGNVGKALPNYIFVKEDDYVEFKIQDPNAFLIPNKDGYSIKAKETFQLNFAESLKRTYRSLWGRYTLWQPAVKALLDPYIDTIKDYYLQAWYPTSIMGKIKDANNTLVDKNESYNGKNIINLSPSKIEEIKSSILAPYLRQKLSDSNRTFDLSFELDKSTKTKVLNALGLDPSIYLTKSKFILNMFPDFKKGANATNKPRMSDITLDMSFSIPLLNGNQVNRRDADQEEQDPLWITEYTIENITY